jgi:hypothetical protein
MSSIEGRLARDIAEETRGVVVTDSDLREAREEIDDRIAIGHKRNHRRTLTVAAAAAVVIPIVGIAAVQLFDSSEKSEPQPASPVPTTVDVDVETFLTGSDPTPELLDGVWRVDNGTVLMKFAIDGAIRFDDGGQLYSDPGATGTYEIDGDLITVTVDGGSDGCAGQTFAMRASIPEPGSLRFVHTQPGNGRCSPEDVPVDGSPLTTDHVWWALEQALPTNSDYLAGFDNSNARGWKPLEANTNAMYGDWLAEGGGYMLELAPGGAYYVADEAAAVVDQGEWSQRGSELTLTSSASSAECSQGDQLVLGGMEQLNSGTLVMRGTVQQNTCEAAWTPDAWIQIPQDG